MKERLSLFSISSFICIHLNLHSPLWGRLSSPQAISGVCDLSKTFPSAVLHLPVLPLLLCMFPLSCCSLETVWELFREQECRGSAQRSAAGGEEREERKAGEGDFSLDEVMDDGFSQSESWARGRRAPDLPLPGHTHTRTHTQGERAEPVEALGWQRDDIQFSSLPITPQLISQSRLLCLYQHTTHDSQLCTRQWSQAPEGHFSGLSHVKSPAKIYPITSWEMEVISEQTTISMLSTHRQLIQQQYCLILRSDLILCYCTDWVMSPG